MVWFNTPDNQIPSISPISPVSECCVSSGAQQMVLESQPLSLQHNKQSKELHRARCSLHACSAVPSGSVRISLANEFMGKCLTTEYQRFIYFFIEYLISLLSNSEMLKY